MEIVIANEGDLAAVLAVQKLAYAPEAALYADAHIAPMMETLEELAEDAKRRHLLKAVVGGELVGSVRYEVVDGVCRIGRLSVLPEYQGRRVGRSLLQACEDAVPEAAAYELFTGARSEGNIRFYERAGYRVVREEMFSDTDKLVYMRKEGRRRKTTGRKRWVLAAVPLLVAIFLLSAAYSKWLMALPGNDGSDEGGVMNFYMYMGAFFVSSVVFIGLMVGLVLLLRKRRKRAGEAL